MKIQLNTDSNIQGTIALEKFVGEKINRELKHFAARLTRVEVYLSDQNSHKSGVDDIQCRIEARAEGLQPVAVVAKAGTKEQALDSAIDKLKAALGTVVGKMSNK